jgi:peptide/nickel transport system substrate-binding protein
MVDPSATVPGDHTTLVENPYYYDPGKQYWSKIVIRFITSPTSLLDALKTGEIQVGAYGTPDTAGEALSAGLKVAYGAQGAGVFGLNPNGAAPGDKALANLKVRQALNYALNRVLIMRALYGKYGQASSVIAATDGVTTELQHYYKYDVAKAKALLAEAGYPNGLTIDGVNMAGNDANLMPAIAQAWEAIGVSLTITTVPSANWLTDAPHYGVIVMPFGTASTAVYYSLLFAPKGLCNFGNWNDSVLSGLNAAAPDQTLKKAVASFEKMNAREVAEAYYVNVGTWDTLFYSNPKKVTNVKVNYYNLVRAHPLDWRP